MSNESSEEKKIEIFHQNRAKWIVDTIFDAKIFNPSLTRDDLQAIEDMIAYDYQSQVDSQKKFLELSYKFNHLKKEI